MQKSCTIFAVMLVLALTVTLMTSADFGLDAGGSSWLGSTAMAQQVPTPNAQLPEISVSLDEQPKGPDYSDTFQNIGFLLLTIAFPYSLGYWLATAIRLPDLSQRLGIILASLVFSISVCFVMWPPKFGIDLQGGVILVYEVDENASLQLLEQDVTPGMANSNLTPQTRLDQGTQQLITQLKRRINPSGTREVVIRAYGENQVEVIIPQSESADLDTIKHLITQAGVLDFMMLANKQDHDFLMSRAEDPSQLGATFVTNRSGERIGRWVYVDPDAMGVVGRYDFTNPSLKPFLNGSQHLVRGGGNGIPFEVLMKLEKPQYRLSGKLLTSAYVARDERGQPAVGFEFGVDGASRMGRLSQENLTEPNMPRNLGIVMDNYLISAPTIQAVITDRGIINGSFTADEAQNLAQVLKSGSLPVVLRKEPISEQKISATLGDDTIRKGEIAITISLIAVLLFMAIYYRVAGVVACFALLFNLVLILAIMIGVKADLTLPGIAGLVLTVGMSVDANVLIYERIREEINGGASLRVALTNGFGKAMSTIVDANLTTLITAAVLYKIGTDEVRGFAVTLFFGILMSMFTAIYVSRGIFEILEKKRLIKTLKFLPSASSIGYDFIGKTRSAVTASIVIILIGLVGVAGRGKDIFDIDFNGGSSVQVYLKAPMAISEVRSKLTGKLPDLTVSAVTMEGVKDQIYKVDTSLSEYGQLGKVALTDRSGKTAEVDLAGEETLSGIIGKLVDADVRILVSPNPEGNGIEFQDDTGADTGTMSVKNVDDNTETASHLKMNFATDNLRYNTGKIPAGVDVVQDRISEVFTGPNGESMLVMHHMSFSEPKSLAPAAKPPAITPPAGQNPGPDTTPTTTKEPASDEKPAPMEEKPAEVKPMEDKGTEEPQPETKPTPEKPATEEKAPESEAKPDESKPEGDMQSLLMPLSSRGLAMIPWNGLFGVVLQDEGDKAEPAAAEPPAVEKPATEKPAEEPKAEEPKADEKPAEEKPAEQPKTDEKPMEEAPMAEKPMPEAPLTGLNEEIEVAPSPLMIQNETSQFNSESTLTFDEGISADTVRSLISGAAFTLNVTPPQVALLDAEGKPLPADSRVNATEWRIKLSTSPAESAEILNQVHTKLDSTPVWPSSSKIGSKVAGDMQTMAVSAILFCLVGIIGYIWFRFQSVNFGLAAVVALVHDVLVTLGAIAVSYWLAPVFGFLQVTEFKISLPVVAAFLTIIGYSLNDTIVIFDRIREVRGKSADLTNEMVNISINQTLGRTLLTSLTTLIVVVILYFIGGEGIHSFSFSLVVGVIAGTYSTIFIACPALLWLMNRSKPVKKVNG